MRDQHIYKVARGSSRRSRPEMTISNERLDFGFPAKQPILGFRVVLFTGGIK